MQHSFDHQCFVDPRRLLVTIYENAGAQSAGLHMDVVKEV